MKRFPRNDNPRSEIHVHNAETKHALHCMLKYPCVYLLILQFAQLSDVGKTLQSLFSIRATDVATSFAGTQLASVSHFRLSRLRRLIIALVGNSLTLPCVKL